MLSMSHARHDDPFRRPVTPQLVRNNDARSVSSCPQKLAEKTNCGKAVPLRLNQNIQDNTVLIDSSPEVMSDAVDLEEDLVEMPFVSSSSTPSPETIGVLLAELIAPAPYRFVTDHNATRCHHLLDIAKAHTKAEIVPDAFGDDLTREPVTTVRIIRHPFSIAADSSSPT